MTDVIDIKQHRHRMRARVPYAPPVMREVAGREGGPRVFEVEHPNLPVVAEEPSRRHRRPWTKRSRRWFYKTLRKSRRLARRGLFRAATWVARANMFIWKLVAWAETPMDWLITNSLNLVIRGLGKGMLLFDKKSRSGHKLIRKYPYRTFQQVYAESLYDSRQLILAASWMLQPITGHAEHSARKDAMYMDIVSADPKNKGARKHFKRVNRRVLHWERKAAAIAAMRGELPEPDQVTEPASDQTAETTGVVEDNLQTGEVVTPEVIQQAEDQPAEEYVSLDELMQNKVIIRDEDAANWEQEEDPIRRSYLYGCQMAYKSYDEDPRFIAESRLISEVRTVVNNSTQSPRTGFIKNQAILGFNDAVAAMRQQLGLEEA